MSNRKLHTEAYTEWKENAGDEYVQAQRRAFLDGFESAANESENFALLREWLENERDTEKQQYEETGDSYNHIRYLTLVDVLVKLHEMGCEPTDD